MARQFRGRDTSTVSGLAESLQLLGRETKVYGCRRLAFAFDPHSSSSKGARGQSRCRVRLPEPGTYSNSAASLCNSETRLRQDAPICARVAPQYLRENVRLNGLLLACRHGMSV